MKNQWGRIADAALREPVSITKHGRVSHVVMSKEEYQSLKKAAFVAKVKVKLEEGIKEADNGEFSDLTIPEIAAKARREFEQKQRNGEV